jgi:hypothetical protein
MNAIIIFDSEKLTMNQVCQQHASCFRIQDCGLLFLHGPKSPLPSRVSVVNQRIQSTNPSTVSVSF